MFSDVLKKEYLCLKSRTDFRDITPDHPMHRLAVLLKKEFLQIFRDRFMLRVVLLLPVVQLLVLPLAADYDIKNFRMAAIDRGREPTLPTKTILDMGELTFMDSSGIAVVLRAKRRMEALGGNLYVVNIPRQAARVLETAGLGRYVNLI